MEQQNQQPSNFLSNPKLPLIAATIVIILTVGGILFLQNIQPAPSPSPPWPQSVGTRECGGLENIECPDNFECLKIDPLPGARGTCMPSDPSVQTVAWQTYRNEEFGFELRYPQGWGVGEGRDQATIISSPYTTSFIEVFAGSGVDARDSNICYTHSSDDFIYWDINQSRGDSTSGSLWFSVPTIDERLQVRKYVSPDGSRYYACEANPRFSFEAVSFGNISEATFDQILSTFRFIND